MKVTSSVTRYSTTLPFSTLPFMGQFPRFARAC